MRSIAGALLRSDGAGGTMPFMTKAQIWGALIFIALIIGVTVFAAMTSGGKSTKGDSVYTGQTATALDSTDHVRGGTQSGLTVMEYGDFQCPACGAYEPLVDQLRAAYPQVQFAFRNFPLYQIHPNAMISSQAAEAAGLQGKYWEMHDLLYKNQNEWAESANADVVSKFFNGYAQSLGLDVKKFDADINADAVKTRVQRDMNSGNAAGIDHTPTFFINGKEIVNPSSYAQFEAILKDALAQSAATTTAQ